MYKNKGLSPLLNDRCNACKFCAWDDERRMYGCDIKGCVDNACFIEYDLLDTINKKTQKQDFSKKGGER